jgi:hypothetical protein
MDICDHHRFAFMHWYKCAGSAILHWLRTHPGCKTRQLDNPRRADGKHTTLADAEQMKGPMDDYFIFTTIRNPFTHLVSTYRQVRRNPHMVTSPSFREWVLAGDLTADTSQGRWRDFAAKDGRIPPNVHIYRTEDLEQMFRELCLRFQLEWRSPDRRNLASDRDKHVGRVVVIDPAIWEVVVEHYREWFLGGWYSLKDLPEGGDDYKFDFRL